MTTPPQLAAEIARAHLDQIRRDVRYRRPGFAWPLDLV
jgi:hypothetical protein